MIDTRLARKHENVRNMKSLFKYDLYKYGLYEYIWHLLLKTNAFTNF